MSSPCSLIVATTAPHTVPWSRLDQRCPFQDAQVSSSTRNCHNLLILLGCTPHRHLRLRFARSVHYMNALLQCGRAQTAQPSDRPQKRCVSSQYSQLLCKTPKGKPQLYILLMASWPFYPELGQRSSTIKHPRVHSRESSPSSSQSLQHRSELFAHVGILFKGQGYRYFSLEMSTCSPRIQQLRLTGSFHFFQQP